MACSDREWEDRAPRQQLSLERQPHFRARERRSRVRRAPPARRQRHQRVLALRPEFELSSARCRLAPTPALWGRREACATTGALRHSQRLWEPLAARRVAAALKRPSPRCCSSGQRRLQPAAVPARRFRRVVVEFDPIARWLLARKLAGAARSAADAEFIAEDQLVFITSGSRARRWA